MSKSISNSFGKEKRRRVYLFLATAICVVTAFVLLQPLQAGAQQIPSLVGCRVSPIPPTDDTEMNTIVTGTKVKTIHVEKQVFDCQAQIMPTPAYTYIADVTIYTEIFEDLANFPSVIPKKTFEAITCVKEAKTGNVLGCQKSSSISSTLPTTLSCLSSVVGFPIEMNTVVSSNGIIKTVEAQKEVLKCDSKTFKDVTIFTEIFENLSLGTIKKTSESVTCVKDVTTAKVLACKASQTAAL